MDWRSLPSLGALRSFAALAETGSLAKAGAALNVSHAAISQRVRALEEELGVPLVGREGRRTALTPEGAQLAAALDAAFSDIRRAVDELTGGDATRPLQITSTPAFTSSWLMPRLSEFRHEHPAIQIMINPSSDVVELKPGGMDVAIRYGRGDWRGLAVELLVPTTYVLVGSPKLLGDREVIEPRDILDLPWLQELGTSEISGWLRDRGVTAPKTGNLIHMPGNLVLEGLRNGDGVSLTTTAVVERELASGQLRVLFEDFRPGLGYYLVTRPGVMRPPLKAFVGWLRRHVRAAEAPADRVPKG